MCGGGGTNTSTTVNSVPEWMSSAGQDIFGKAKKFYEGGYQDYNGQRQAPFSPTQNAAFDQVRGYQPPNVTGEAMNYVRQAASPISTERITDEGGRLGKISDYTNPYAANALTPGIEAIQRSATAQRRQIGDNAMSAHAYGDARHGITEGRSYLDENKAVGDLVSTGMANAYNTAMTQRSGDLDRYMNTDVANRAASMGAANALPGIANADQTSFLSRMNALLGVGGLEQQQAQTGLDIPYQQYQAKQQDAYDKLASLVSVIGGVPYTRTSTTTSPKPNDMGGLFGGLGSLLGAALF